jgi:hypothetical protein
MLPSLQDLSDSCLLNNVKDFKNVEDKTIAEFVLYLSEVDTRKLYRDIGFSSLYSYCTQGLGYSESSAYRRIQAARSLEDNPEIYELLRDGKLSLCAVAEISKVIKPDNKAELLELSQGKPKTVVQKLVVQYQPAVAPLKREKVVAKRVIVENKDPLFSTSNAPKSKEETRFTFTAEVDQEFIDLLKEAKDLIGFVPSAEVLKRALKEFVSKRKVIPRVVKKREIESPAAKESKANIKSRYVSKAVAHRVRERDQYQCTFIGPDGRRCSETCGLHLDHIEPFALGAASEISNLRLLCFAHNQFSLKKLLVLKKLKATFRAKSTR